MREVTATGAARAAAPAPAPAPAAAPAAAGAAAAAGVRAGARAGARRRYVAVAAVVLAVLAVGLLGPVAALHGTGESAAPGTAGIAVLRATVFAAVCVPAGELYAQWLTRRVPDARGAPRPVSRAPVAAAVGCAAALGLAGVVAAGNLVPHRLSDMDLTGLSRTRDGVLALVEVNAFLLAALAARARRPAYRALPVAAVVTAEALRAHPPWEYAPLTGTALTAVHLTCAVVWTGGLWQVVRTVRRWRARHGGPGAGAASALLSRYARGAVLLPVALAATGTLSALRRMPPATVLGQLTDTAYGRTLLFKLALVALAAALALCARRCLRGNAPRAAGAPARTEVRVLGAVLAVSALLTALPLPIRW